MADWKAILELAGRTKGPPPSEEDIALLQKVTVKQMSSIIDFKMAGMNPDQILASLKEGVKKREALVNVKQKQDETKDAFFAKRMAQRQAQGSVTNDKLDDIGRKLKAKEAEQKALDEQNLRKSRFDFFRQLEQSVNKKDDLAATVRAERSKVLADRKKAHEDRRKRAAAAGTPDFVDSDEDRAIAAEEAKLKSAAACNERRIKTNKKAKKPLVAPGAQLRGTENDEEVWSEGIGTDAQQVARAGVWGAALDAESALEMSPKERLEAETKRLEEDREMGLSDRDIVALAAARVAELDAALCRAAALKKEVAAVAGGAPSQIFFHGDTARYQNLARRADLVMTMPRKLRQAAETAAHEHDKALGYSPIECERRHQERVAHLELAALREELRQDARMAVWADTYVRVSDSDARATMFGNVKKNDYDAGYNPTEATHLSAERLRHIELAWLRAADEKAEDPNDATKFRAYARRADHYLRYPLSYRHQQDEVANKEDDEALPAGAAAAARTARARHIELAIARERLCPIHPFALLAATLVRASKSAPQAELARMRSQDGDMELTADQCITRASQRRAMLEAAKALATDEQAENTSDTATFRIFAVRADALVRLPPSRQQQARNKYMDSLERQRGACMGESDEAASEWDRHLSMAAERFKPTPEDLAELADVLVSVSPQERVAKENELRAAEGRAQDPADALHAAALRAHHIELAALRKLDTPASCPDVEQWLERARIADLLTQRYPTAAAQDREIARLNADDRTFLPAALAETVAKARVEHIQLARRRQKLVSLPLTMITASYIASLPRRRQLAEDAKQMKADEDAGLTDEEVILSELRRKLALSDARARLVGEEAEMADLRGNPATFRVEAIRADMMKAVGPKERQLMNAGITRVDQILGIPDDQKAQQKDLRAEHAKEADARIVLLADTWVFLSKLAQDDALAERKAEEEEAGYAADVVTERDAERRAALARAKEDAEGRAMWLARMAEHRRDVEEERLLRRDATMGLSENQVEERAAQRAALLDKALASLAAAAKEGKAVPPAAAEARVADAASYVPARRKRHGDQAGLDLDSIAAQLAFAERSDEILLLPAADQEAAIAADQAKDAAIVGIAEPELVSRSSERARHRELARVRRDDEITADVEGEAAVAWREYAREADIMVRVSGPKLRELEALIAAREAKLSDKVRSERQVERELHLEMAEERKKKCSETTFGATADGLVRLSKGALAAQERRLEQEDAEAGLSVDDIAINAARRKRELSLARRRLATEKADPAAQDLDATGLAGYRAEALRADKLVRMPKEQREEEEIAIDAALEEAGMPDDEIEVRRRARAAHLILAEKRYLDHRKRLGLELPTDDELRLRHEDGAESDLDPYVGDVAEVAVIEAKDKEREQAELDSLEKQAAALGKDAGELELLLEADVTNAMEKERDRELRGEGEESEAEEEDQAAKMKRLLAEEDEWESEAGLALAGAGKDDDDDDARSFDGDNAVTASLEETLQLGDSKAEAEFETAVKEQEEEEVDDEDEEDAPEEPLHESLKDLKTPVGEFEIAMDAEATGPDFLTPCFPVTKFSPDAGWAGRGQLKRVWKVDFVNRELVNLTTEGKVQKSHKSSKILQLEKNIIDYRRLRMMMFDANHSYELVFENAEQREKFFECANALRPALRVYCPALVPDGSIYSNAKLYADAEDESKGVARLNATKKPWERVTLWTGTWDMGGRPPPPIEAANTDEGSPLEFWLPRDKYDVYVCSVQGASYRKDEKDWFKYVREFLGGSYVTIASMSVGDLLLMVAVRKKSLLKVTNVEGTTIPNLRSQTESKECGGVAISLKYLETSLVFFNVKLAQAADKVRLRNANLKEVFEGTSLAIKDVCVSTQFDHAFIMGNLGYRHKLDAAATKAAIRDDMFEDIIKKDELAELLKGRSLADGFKDASEVLFRPTFPLKPGSDAYSGAEVPCYPDRVLTRSAPHLDGCLVPDLYVSAEEVTISEHAPVFASFALQCRRPFVSLFDPLTDNPCRIVVQAASASHDGLAPLNKAQLTFWGTFCDGPSFSRPVKKLTEWRKDDLPMLVSHTHHRETLKLHHFVVSYRDQSFKDAKKGYRGSCIVPIKTVVEAKGQPVRISAPLVYMGGRLGQMTFILQLLEVKPV